MSVTQRPLVNHFSQEFNEMEEAEHINGEESTEQAKLMGSKEDKVSIDSDASKQTYADQQRQRENNQNTSLLNQNNNQSSLGNSVPHNMAYQNPYFSFGMGNPFTVPELFESPRYPPRNSFDALADFNSFRLQQQFLLQQQQQQQQLQQQQQQQQQQVQQQQSQQFAQPMSHQQQLQQAQQLQPHQITQQQQQQLNNGNRQLNDKNPAVMPVNDDRFQLYYEREARWSEVRKYSDLIRRFAHEASHLEITKENYYDLYNMAVCLLKSVDSLDPDKLHTALPQRKQSEILGNTLNNQLISHPAAAAAMALQQADLEFLQGRKSFDLYYNRASLDASFLPKYSSDFSALFYGNPALGGMGGIGGGVGVSPSPFLTNPAAIMNHPAAAANQPMNHNNNNNNNNHNATYNNTSVSQLIKSDPNGSMKLNGNNTNGIPNNNNNMNNNINSNSRGTNSPSENYEENQDDGRKKRRRKRTVYASRRNLHCHMCGVTETPEWRRGPAGDHTLCNACGLHYAKSLKKQRKEREGRKHSIEMLLNQGPVTTQGSQPSTSPVNSTSSSSPIPELNNSSNNANPPPETKTM